MDCFANETNMFAYDNPEPIASHMACEGSCTNAWQETLIATERNESVFVSFLLKLRKFIYEKIFVR